MKGIHLFLILTFVFSALFIITAKAEEKVEVPPWLTVDGMEIIQIGNARYLLPKGTKIRKRAGVITFEGPGEYTARRLLDFEERLQANEKEVKRLKRVLGKKKRE